MNELQVLEQKRDEIAFSMIEANNEELEQLQFELEEIEQQIEQLRGDYNDA